MKILSMTDAGLMVQADGFIKCIPYDELSPDHEALKSASKSAVWYIGIKVGYELGRRSNSLG